MTERLVEEPVVVHHFSSFSKIRVYIEFRWSWIHGRHFPHMSWTASRGSPLEIWTFQAELCLGMRFEIIFSQSWWFSCPGDAEKGELEGANQICVETQPLRGRWFNQSFALGPAELIFNQYIRANMLIRAQFSLSVPAESTIGDGLKSIPDLQSHSITLLSVLW